MAAAPGMGQPTASMVDGLYRTAITQQSERRLRRLINVFRSLTRMENPVRIPRQYQAITKVTHTPFVRDAWHRVTAALTHEDPVAHIQPLDVTIQARNAANIGERWTMAAREQLTRDLGYDVIWQAAAAMIRDGESVLKCVHRPDAWATFPTRGMDDQGSKFDEEPDDFLKRAERFKKRAPLPFAWKVVDRLQMVFGDGEYGDNWALEYGEYPRPFLSSRYGMPEQSGKLVSPARVLAGEPRPEGYSASATGVSIKMEYWDANWWHVVIDGEDAPGFPMPNPYRPRLPYFRARPDLESESILYSLMFLVPGLDRLITMKENWAYLSAYPNPVIRSIPNPAGTLDLPTGEDDQASTLKWEPGKAIELPVGKTMDFLVPPPTGQDLNQMIQLIRQMIDVAGIPSVLRGSSMSGDSGYLANQMYAAALSMYRRIALASSRQLEEAFEFFWYVIEHRIKSTVYVLAAADSSGKSAKKWLGLGADMRTGENVANVADLGPLTWTFKPVLPTDEQARVSIAIQATNAPKPLFSRRYAREHFANVEDPEAMADEIAVEDALDTDPVLKQLITQKALEAAGLAPPEPDPTGAGGPPVDPMMAGMPPDMGGGMIPPGPTELMPSQPPGQMGAGFPSVPGVTRPLMPTPPGQMPPPGLRVNGGWPGMPGNQGPPLPGPG